MIRFEHHHEPLLPQRAFLVRMVRSLAAAGILIFSALSVGTLGYHSFGKLNWIDSFYNASMILTGMGPANSLPTNLGKLFASGYALFSGVVFITSMGVFLAPLLHRFLHHFHLDLDRKK